MTHLPASAAALSESMLRIVESAPEVKRRSQFFLWSQSDLQRWLPHKLMACGAYARDRREMVFDAFNSVPVPDQLLRPLLNPHAALIPLAIGAWKRSRMRACLLDLPMSPGGAPTLQTFIDSGYRQLLVHGVSRPGRPDELESLFILGSPDHRYDEAARQALEMLLPCLHLTYQRVYLTECEVESWSGSSPMGLARSSSGTLAQVITLREREILNWVRCGMSNQQISEKLGISALTVKNHVQKILRKLGAANRAQAVAKAMSMDMLGAGLDERASSAPGTT